MQSDAAFVALSAQANDIAQALSVAEEALSCSTAEVAETKSVIAMLEADAASLRDQLAAETTAHGRTSSELSTVRRSLRQAEDRLRTSEEKMTELSHQLDFMRLDNVELKADVVQAQDALLTERQNSENLAKELADTNEQVQRLRADASAAEGRLREATESGAQSTAKLTAEVQALKAEIKTLKAASRDLRDRLNVSEAERMEADAQWASATEQVLFTEVKLRREEELRHEIVQSLEREIKSSTEERRKLEKFRDALADKIRDLQSRNNVLQLRVDALLESDKAKTEALQSAEARLEKAESQLEELYVQVSDGPVDARIAHLQRATAGLQESLESMQEQNSVFKSLMQEEIAGRVKAEEEIMQLKSQLAVLSFSNSSTPPTPVIPPPILMPSASPASQESSLLATPDLSKGPMLSNPLGSSDCLFEGDSIIESLTITMGLGLSA